MQTGNLKINTPMMFKNTFIKKKYHEVPVDLEKHRPAADAASRLECPKCRKTHTQEDLTANFRVCRSCGYHFTMTARERIVLLADEGSFQEINQALRSRNPLDFPDYDQKLSSAQSETGLNEAIITGLAAIGGHRVVLGAMDSRFMMASMGSVVGEKVARAAETAIEQKLPLNLCVASGGARMQEGMVALMQMAKTSAIIERVHQAGLLFVAIITNPTTGGVLASFPSLADIVIAEPGALIGFTGPRVIEQTIKQKLPDTFQRSEFLLERGMLDLVTERKQLRAVLENLCRLHLGGRNAETV